MRKKAYKNLYSSFRTNSIHEHHIHLQEESEANSNRGNTYIKLKGLGNLATHKVAVQFNKPSFHLKTVEDRRNYENIAAKIYFDTKNVNFEFSAKI